MSFDWLSLYKVAKALNKTAKQLDSSAEQEAFYRSAISRAYYSVFNLSFRRMQSFWGNDPSSEGIQKHQWTIDRFRHFRPHSEREAQKSKALDYNQIAQSLHRLRGYRNAADYDDKMPNSNFAKSATIAMRDAQKILDLLAKHE